MRTITFRAGTPEQVVIEVPDGFEVMTCEEYHRLHQAHRILSDLDRCEHGRHRGDICSGEKACNGPSKGNPKIQPGQTIGYNLSGNPYWMPHTPGNITDWAGAAGARNT